AVEDQGHALLDQGARLDALGHEQIELGGDLDQVLFGDGLQAAPLVVGEPKLHPGSVTNHAAPVSAPTPAATVHHAPKLTPRPTRAAPTAMSRAMGTNRDISAVTWGSAELIPFAWPLRSSTSSGAWWAARSACPHSRPPLLRPAGRPAHPPSSSFAFARWTTSGRGRRSSDASIAWPGIRWSLRCGSGSMTRSAAGRHGTISATRWGGF